MLVLPMFCVRFIMYIDDFVFIDLLGKKISKERMSEIQAKIDADRRLLESKKDMAEEERNKVKADLEEKEDELKNYQ